MPWLTLILVALNILVFQAENGSETLCYAHGLIPASFRPAALVSSLFLHDPAGPAHIAANMACLVVFGAIVEGALGGLPFLALYLAAGALGGLLHVAVDPSSTAPLVGASGAVFGVLAVAAVVRSRTLGFAVAFAGVEIWHAFFGGNGNVSFACHLGGFAAGVVVVAALRVDGSEALETA